MMQEFCHECGHPMIWDTKSKMYRCSYIEYSKLIQSHEDRVQKGSTKNDTRS
jgi:DNA-directed RNA polymerase subunit M/transcription elongation factor TFIIS